MNKILKYILSGLSVILLMGSCDLDKYPYDGVSPEGLWTTTGDTTKLRNGLYSRLRSVTGGVYYHISNIQGDEFNATVGFGNNGGDMHTWQFTSSQYDIEDYWQALFSAITNTNNVINTVDNAAPATPKEQRDVDRVTAEAYFIRALCYHSLAIRFAKDYETGTASSDLGLPILKVYDVNAKPSRASLADTYAFIKEDITEARKLLPTISPMTYMSNKSNALGYLSHDALDLFEARVDLYMHNYSTAVTLAEKIINKYTMASTKADFNTMWKNDTGSEIIFQPIMTIDERGMSLGVYLQYSLGSQAYSPYFIPSQWVVDLYEQDKDIRFDTYFWQEKVVSSNQSADDIYVLAKFPGNPALQKDGNIYEYYNMHKPLRAAEAYLIAAEASYAGGSEGNALSYLNDLRKIRGASEFTSLTGTALFDQIKNEWIREFIGEGRRMDNLKRWHDGFQRRAVQNEDITVPGELFTTFSAQANNIKFVWEIPSNDLSANKNLEPNW